MQERRIKRKKELEAMSKVSRKKVQKIHESQGNKYMHKVIEDKYQNDIVLPEIARQKAIFDENKNTYKKNYEAIQRQRNAYSVAMAKAGDIRRVGTNRSALSSI